ncbi:probable leucine-rich repeat receptor-like protein kinase At1g35710 [Triticum dicoccoides]|uniref:probable leucine-rich repeat receptor-like protein kinase At1g35710 n=1 Tax=Triticum dicoccoides TaxID=85692 RepID=UPI00189005CB|nr:probable leucine-rich repeat receptor-like protein kinase At1g35710 [Triticum dicoccoides]
MKHLHPVGLLLSCSCLLLCAVALVRADTRREAEALVRWKASLTSADESLGPWSLANFTSLCRWTHITCDSAGHILGLDLEGAILNGTLDKFDFSAFPHMERLILDHNSLYGTIPAGIGNLTSLVVLNISWNPYLGGAIPRSIGQLKHLAVLQLSGLGLNGMLPQEIGNLTSLEELYLDWITLTGSIPQTIGMLMKLRVLSLLNNNLTGSIPHEIGNMTELQEIYFSYNYLEGQLPGAISHLIKLQSLYLSENQLTGHIVPELGNSSLDLVDIGNNNFSGQFPSSICVGGTLRMVRAEYNGFTSIHHHTFQNCTTIQLVFFTENNIIADLRDCFGNHLQELQMMDFTQNKLYGTLLTDRDEVFLCNYTRLNLLDLSNNDLHGGLSKCFWDMPSLAFMDLSSNSFSGVVPFSRTCGSILNYLHLANNNFKGTFPLGLKKCKYLFTLDLGGNHFSGMAGIDLSGNSLSQEIPNGLTTLLGLRYLNLSGNHLLGCIPEDIGNLVLLESLDLSQNQLSGEIPLSFADLKGMSTLNLSTNQLSGRIPTGSQLQTLDDPSIYSNNPGLCGFPLKKCVNSSTWTQTETSFDEDREALWLYCFVAAGFIFGFWLYWGFFLFCSETWRYSFYQYVDNMQAKVTKKIHSCISCFQVKGPE